MSVFKMPEDQKRLTLNDLQDLFTRYDTKQGPLESVLGHAISNFNNNQLPSAPTESLPTAIKTDIPRLDLTNFNMPVGRGSWFNRQPDSPSLIGLMQKQKQQEADTQSEKGRVKLFMSAFPSEFTGHDPSEFTNVKEAQAALKLIQDNGLKQADLERKKKKDAADIALKRGKQPPANPFTIPGAQTQAAPAKTAADVLNKFGF